MKCEEIQPLLDAYIDQELDLVHDIEVATHLQRCQECTRQYETLLALQAMLRTRTTYYVPPASFHRRLRRALRRVSPRPLGWRPWLLGAAAVVLVVLVGTRMAHWTPLPIRQSSSRRYERWWRRIYALYRWIILLTSSRVIRTRSNPGSVTSSPLPRQCAILPHTTSYWWAPGLII